MRANARSEMTMAADGGVSSSAAADSGCGKSTFMRRLTGIFGGTNVGPLGGGFDNGGWETNTLVSDTTTVICLDDYHLNDRGGRKVTGRTALDLAENNFDLMYEQLKELKAGNKIQKPIYNHNGTLDAPEEITLTQIVIVEGLHPMRTCAAHCSNSLYLDITTTSSSPGRSARHGRARPLSGASSSPSRRKPDFTPSPPQSGQGRRRGDSGLPTDSIPDEKEASPKVKFTRRRQGEFGSCLPV